ncbi:PTS transporter subunit IIC [Shouchella shacheensis]|uniref:PTS transporter subunit IIC n=1 Tax=Shouchella shacheensis TaxID=1649580 RepID=UPI0007404BF4|nr:PTS sugar transporter subunit IIC [Shouchella shacheensis]
MKSFMARKGVKPSFHTYIIQAMSQMTLGLFSTLIIGIIIRTVGEQIEVQAIIDTGQFAMDMMGAAIGAAVALALSAPRLVVLSTIACGAFGAVLGGPAGSFIASIVAAEVGKLIAGETKIDIIVTPLLTIFSGFAVAASVGPLIGYGMQQLGATIMWASAQQPLLMSVVVAILMGLALTAPISSAALGIMLGLDGAVAGAAAIGCAGQMVGFAVSSFRENRWSGVVALGIGTSMLQVANIARKPTILIPPTLAGAVAAPVGTMAFNLVSNAAGSGMGTSGMVGPIMTFSEMGFSTEVVLAALVAYILLPAVVSLAASEWMRKAGYIKLNDMKIEAA